MISVFLISAVAEKVRSAMMRMYQANLNQTSLGNIRRPSGAKAPWCSLAEEKKKEKKRKTGGCCAETLLWWLAKPSSVPGGRAEEMKSREDMLGRPLARQPPGGATLHSIYRGSIVCVWRPQTWGEPSHGGQSSGGPADELTIRQTGKVTPDAASPGKILIFGLHV